MVSLLLRRFQLQTTMLAVIEAVLGSASLPGWDPHACSDIFLALPSCSLVLDHVLEVVDLVSQGLHLGVMDLLHVLLEPRPQREESIAFAAPEAACLWEPSHIGPMKLPGLMSRVPRNPNSMLLLFG